MTERGTKLLLDLKVRQLDGEHMNCPCCGKNTLLEPYSANKKSHVADLFICESCAAREEGLLSMNATLSHLDFKVFETHAPENDFKALSNKEVLEQAKSEQEDVLWDIYYQCKADPKNATEICRWGLERLPGASELLYTTNDLHVRYPAKKGHAWIRLYFKDGQDWIAGGYSKD